MSVKDRGFGSMDRMKQRAIASQGGKAAHEKGTAHEWTSSEAKAAGQKGGKASAAARKLRKERAMEEMLMQERDEDTLDYD